MLNNNSIMDEVTPLAFHLGQNYPNPFSEKTTVKYCVAYKTRVQITVYDSDGKVIEKLVDEEKKPGTYEVEFSACHSRESLPDGKAGGNPLNGYYYYKMIAGDFTSEKKWLCINKLSGRLNMKSFLQTLFFFLLVTQMCFGQWYQQNSPTTQNLNAVTFTDANNGLAVGDSGIIVRTSNGGTSWNLVPTDVSNDLTAMFFIDDNNGWIVGDGLYTEDDSARILHTSDGGLNWTTQKTVPTSTLSDIFFIDQNNGFATGHVYEDDPNICYGCWLYSILLKTNNGGITWSQLDYDSLNVPQRIYFIDANNGWMMRGGCGSDCWGDFNKTTDGGNSWIQKGCCGHFYDIQFTNFNNAIAVGIARNYNSAPLLDDPMGKITRTTDGGNTWETQFIIDEFTIWFRSVFCVTEDTYVIVAHVNGGGDVLYFYWTTDGGITWFPRPTDIEERVNRVFFTDAFTGWAVGENGVILHTTNGGVSFVEEEEIDEIPTEFVLSQNYPNPFNPSTKIKYAVPQSSNVMIKVFDILGNEIETLINEEKPAGTYEVTWYAGGLPSGVYFYQLKAGSFVETKKMILLK